MVNIFIANLDWSITSEDLKTTFSTFGDVHYAHVVFEKETKRSRGYGYVEMESAESAIAAIEALNGMEINGRAIDVKIASPKTNRPKKEAKPIEKKPFKKNSGFKPGGFNKGGGGNYNNRGGGYQNREGGGSYNRENRPAQDNSSSSDRVMRPRRPRTDEGEKRYEKIDRPTQKPEENE
jgi:RNA recognition motif-containing protein